MVNNIATRYPNNLLSLEDEACTNLWKNKSVSDAL